MNLTRTVRVSIWQPPTKRRAGVMQRAAEGSARTGGAPASWPNLARWRSPLSTLGPPPVRGGGQSRAAPEGEPRLHVARIGRPRRPRDCGGRGSRLHAGTQGHCQERGESFRAEIHLLSSWFPGTRTDRRSSASSMPSDVRYFTSLLGTTRRASPRRGSLSSHRARVSGTLDRVLLAYPYYRSESPAPMPVAANGRGAGGSCVAYC